MRLLLLSASHIPQKTGGKTLVLCCFSFRFSLVSQKSFNSLQQFIEVFRDGKVHILRSRYVTSSTYFSAPGSFVQEPGQVKSGWSCYQTFRHSQFCLSMSQLTICPSCYIYIVAGFFLGQNWSSVVADRHGHPHTAKSTLVPT